MKPYDSHPDVPIWLAALNGQLLTTTELNVLNFIFWCTKHGCRTSNDRIGIFTHKSHATVQRAVMKLYSMDLIAIENFGKRTRTLKAVHWPDQATWLKYKKLQGKIESDAAHYAPHIPLLDKTPPLQGVSSRGGLESPFQGDDILPSSAGGLRCSGGGERPVPTYQQAATEQRDKLIEAGWSRDEAERKTRKRYPQAKFEGSK